VNRGLDLGRAGDAEEDDLARSGQRRRRGRFGGAGGEQVGEPFAVAMHGVGQGMPLGEQVLRYAVAHQSRCADESDRCHVLVLCHRKKLPLPLK
jgi:hypothetical protein